MNKQLHKVRGFTLIELLVVMAIIMILAGLVLTVIPYVNKKQARTRAEAEIKGLSAALEAYKADNAVYPTDGSTSVGSTGLNYTAALDARVNGDPTQSVYINAGLVLYRALSGDRNLDQTVDHTSTTDSSLDLDGNPLTTPLNGPPNTYYTFNASQIVVSTSTQKVTSITDPFGYSYGYSTAYAEDMAKNDANGGTTAPANGYNPTFDLWSTAGTVASSSDSTAQTQTKRAQWVINWQNSGANVGQ